MRNMTRDNISISLDCGDDGQTKYKSCENNGQTKYKSERIIGGKPKKVIVDKYDTITNRNPSKDELKELKIFPNENYKNYKKYRKYTDEELLNYLIQFYDKNGRIPIENDFNGNPKYPNYGTYINYLGSWDNAIEKAGLDKRKKIVPILYTDEELISYMTY